MFGCGRSPRPASRRGRSRRCAGSPASPRSRPVSERRLVAYTAPGDDELVFSLLVLGHRSGRRCRHPRPAPGRRASPLSPDSPTDALVAGSWAARNGLGSGRRDPARRPARGPSAAADHRPHGRHRLRRARARRGARGVADDARRVVHRAGPDPLPRPRSRRGRRVGHARTRHRQPGRAVHRRDARGRRRAARIGAGELRQRRLPVRPGGDGGRGVPRREHAGHDGRRADARARPAARGRHDLAPGPRHRPAPGHRARRRGSGPRHPRRHPPRLGHDRLPLLHPRRTRRRPAAAAARPAARLRAGPGRHARERPHPGHARRAPVAGGCAAIRRRAPAWGSSTGSGGWSWRSS